MNKVISSIPLAQTIVEACAYFGVHHVVISPGSRNAPLTLSFSNHPDISTYSIVDERVAGFFALGIAQQTQKPVAVVCTSGSALLNYYPAVAEAFYSDIPLMVISADRPSHLIDIGDGQTIRQEKAIHPHVTYSACLKEDVRNGDNSNVQKYNEIELAKAFQQCLKRQSPVHINAPFDEPLYQQTDHVAIDLEVFKQLEINVPSVIDRDLANAFVSDWNKSKRKLIIVGTHFPNTIAKEIIQFWAEDPSVLVFKETTSNLDHPSFVSSIDGIVAPIEKRVDADEAFKQLQPDLLISFGGLIVSKKVKAFLRNYQPKKHYHIHPQKAYATFFMKPIHLKTTANSFFSRLLPRLRKLDSNYFNYWNKINQMQNKKRDAYVDQIPFSDFSCFAKIFEHIPNHEHLQLANSSTIRYANLMELPNPTEVFCNRGTSGIDGSTSTAIGASIIQQKPTTFITGDLSFFYDSNALWNNYVPPNFKMIVINNSGGGIFRILPGEKQKKYYQTYFETTHAHNASHLAKMYNWDYQKASNMEELDKELKVFFEPQTQPKLLEIFTPRELNDQILLDYFKE